jgi:uncharacterized OsmC-like protein
MTAQAATDQATTIVNGVDVDYVMGVVAQVKGNADIAQFQFRAANQWLDGGHNRSTVKDFYGACKEDDTRTEPFVMEADEPPVLGSNDKAPNPVEFVLHGLAACLTTTMAYHAAVRGIDIDAISSTLEGNLDLRGFLGLSEDVRKGYHHVRVTMTVKSDASADQLRELAMYSPVYDIVSNSLPVELVIQKG